MLHPQPLVITSVNLDSMTFLMNGCMLCHDIAKKVLEMPFLASMQLTTISSSCQENTSIFNFTLPSVNLLCGR